MLVILTPQGVTDATATAKHLAEYATSTGKPVIASWVGGKDVQEGRNVLRQAGIPCFEYPDLAVRMWNYLVKYGRTIADLTKNETLSSKDLVPAGAKDAAMAIMKEAYDAKRSYLTEYESKKVLEAYGIKICATEVAFTPEEAAQKAKEIGFPVVVKIHSETITHKSDVGGVKVNLKTEEEVIAVYKDMEQRIGRPGFLGVTVQAMIDLKGSEVIIGMNRDPQYGPVLVFGAGGVLVEIFKDSALAIPPLNLEEAKATIEKTKIYKALKGFRGEPAVDLQGLAETLVKFSYLISDLKIVKELDINPLLAKTDAVIALDARVIISFDEMQGAMCYEE
ncbi:Acetyl-CoA synthetase [Carpediemonas membranifera]|uniref:Acetyl-CoA synthetase n=1 Tax=Carpediemonas membranifera TaxID=201153 RepID=A0A8J6E210_9EUKA|nr:Acetyl-CoA synthetase [Carpediemonas membranifera]|eukprot:KAG9393731.1 Acetyl-CoA synthetase [Carpediemonas membranifera]